MSFSNDKRIVMTLDAGGTGLEFSAIQGNEAMIDPVRIPTEADDLERCLSNIARGFEQVRQMLPEQPVAISFAFPGPADYPAGIIGDLGNLPAFRGGVALGPMLEERFDIPVFINNDGDLFVYGEAMAGFLPRVNAYLAEAGSPKRYRNLFGVTLGTGFGGGIVSDGTLLLGDNSVGGEAWLLRNKLQPDWNAEEGCCIRAVRRWYAEVAGCALEEVPDPKTIYEIGIGKAEGSREAACESFRRLGEVVGDAVAQAVTLLDSLVVVGGGLAGAGDLFLPSLVGAMNDVFHAPQGTLRRLVQEVFNFEDEQQRIGLLKESGREIAVPGTDRQVWYESEKRTTVGISCLGTSHAVSIGAYAYALNRLDQRVSAQ